MHRLLNGYPRSDLGTGAEYTKQKYKTGRRKSARTIMYKAVKACVDASIHRFSGVSRFQDIATQPVNNPGGLNWISSGYFGLYNQSAQAPIAPTTVLCKTPSHWYDLTSIDNVICPAGGGANVLVQPPVMYEMNFPISRSPTGTSRPVITKPPQWVSWSGQDFNNTGTSAYWLNESASYNNVIQNAVVGQTIQHRKMVLDYVHAKLLLYGAPAVTTKYKICVVGFQEDYMDLLEPQLTGNNINPEATDCMMAYDALLSCFMRHPLNSQLWGKYKHLFKIYKEVDAVLQPRLSTESDRATGHVKEIDLFLPFGTTLNYDWPTYNTVVPVAGNAGTSEYLNAPGAFSRDMGTVSTACRLRQRRYLMVMASNFIYTSTADYDTGQTAPYNSAINTTPGYDVILRRRMVDISNN